MNRFFVSSLLVVGTYAHGLILMTKGANGVNAPGSCVLDGTPRDCIVNACGAQADTGIIRDKEIESGRYGALGWTQGGGDCKPDAVINEYMGLGTAPRYTGGRQSTGEADDLSQFGFASRVKRREEYDLHAHELFSRDSSLNGPLVGGLGSGGDRTSYPVETIVGDYTGWGKDHGLPTTDDKDQISLIYRQINEDGAGPLTAAIDPSSAATDWKAFKSAKVVNNVPGDSPVGLSLATNTNFAVKVQVPNGTVCEGKVAGLDNVCFVRLRNIASAGPFGGAGFFTQSDGARKRAIAYRLKKRMEMNRSK
ncbi:hypothetical protein V500_02661 [Pseudogymnoascus sp. VKM F-4518 (FW-2643)]|nr:hypothetical protein V500_02661 [Pseudogymnoascus sp. VKM F-4518 (FW-2643)]